MLRIDEYRRNLPRESDRWATSDRGWAWDTARENDFNAKCFAHYLDYRGTSEQGRAGKLVHVCIVGHGVVWVRNVADARQAIRSAFRRYARGK